MSPEFGDGWRSVLNGLATAVATGSKPEHRDVRFRFARFVATAGFVAWCLYAAVRPPAPEVHRPLGMALALAAAVPVVLTEISPLWAWRIIIVMGAVSPWVYPTLTSEWGWPWTPSLGGAALVVLYRVGRAHCRSVLLWVFVLTTTVAVALPLREYTHGLVMAVGIAVSLVLGYLLRLLRGAERDRLEQRRHRGEQQVRAATLAERNTIARELHDVVAHHMSVLALRSDSARYRFPDLSEELREEFAAMHATARDGLTEMRRLLRVLRSSEDAPGAPQPTAEEIGELVDRVRDNGVEVLLHQEANLDQLPAGVALCTYRIVQEALSNAIRHAPGSSARVEITHGDAEVRITVHNGAAAGRTITEPEDSTDSGEAVQGHGLIGMRERAAMLGGSVQAGADGAGGFLVTAILPVDGGTPPDER